MSLFKKLSLLFIITFFALLLNVFPTKNNANAASFDVNLSVRNDSNENKDWNNTSIDKCYSGDVEVQVRDANSTRTVKYTSGPDSCSHAIKVYNSSEAGEPTVYTVKLIKPSKTLNYIDVFNPATSQHATSKGSTISTNAISPSYRKATVTFGLPPVYKLNVAYVLKDKNNNFSIDSNEDCYTGKLDLLVNGNGKTWSRTTECTPRFTINHDGTSNVKIVLPDNSDYTYAGYKKSDDKSDHEVKLVTDSPRNATSINGDGTVYFFIKAKNDGGNGGGDGGGGGNTCSDPKLTLAGKEGNTFTVKITNPCNNEHDYELKANPPGGASSGWKAKISGEKVKKVNSNDVITVGKNDTAQFKVKIDPPDNPSAGPHRTVVSAVQKDKPKNKDTIKLTTKIGQDQSCSRKDPKLSSADRDKNGKKGETITYSVELKNNNSPCKPPADFDITVDKPNGWTVKLLKGNGDNLGGEIKNLPSASSKLFKVKVSSPNNAQRGTTETITIKAAQKGANNNLKDSIALKYTVGQDDDNTCTGSDIKPYFECQNNACVAVQACGNNSGGCTSAGGSCGDNSCEGSDIKPHFVCEGNACVKKASCGQNTEGCASEGQACGDNGGDPTKVSFVIGLDAIGTTGTNTVALSNNSNKNPKHPQRKIFVEIFNNSNDKVEEVEADIKYVAGESTQNYGKFIGTATLSDDFNTGNYIVKVKVDGRLKKQIPGIQRLEARKINSMDPVNLIAGDIDNDNKIGILDYGILISCSIFARTDDAKKICNENESYKLLSDLNDDGEDENTPNVDQLDYGYFIQEYSVQAGD